jgi:serine/threonine protein phosphatase PrpC
VDFIAYGLTDIGRVRRENQDSFIIDEKSGFFAVADGMGGMSAGALASKYAVNVLFEPTIRSKTTNFTIFLASDSFELKIT